MPGYSLPNPSDPYGIPIPSGTFSSVPGPVPGSVGFPSAAGSGILGMNPAGLAMTGAGIGSSILGDVLQANAQNTGANRQWQLIQSELARRNGIQAAMAPMLATSAGIQDPGQRAQLMSAVSGSGVGEMGAGGQQPSINATHALPGQTHTNANDFVQKVENPFGQAMAQISRGGSLQDLKNAYQSYLQGVQNFRSSGGANARVSGQSVTNPALQKTFSTLWSQLGGGQAPILGQ